MCLEALYLYIYIYIYIYIYMCVCVCVCVRARLIINIRFYIFGIYFVNSQFRMYVRMD